MNLTIKITCDNEAFGDTLDSINSEIHRILNSFDPLPYDHHNLYDLNGNKVGEAVITDDPT